MVHAGARAPLEARARSGGATGPACSCRPRTRAIGWWTGCRSTRALRLVPLGIDARFSPGEPPEGLRERLGLEGPFVPTVGTLSPARTSRLRSTFERLVAAGRPPVGNRRRSRLARRAVGRADPELSGCGADRDDRPRDDDDLIGLYRAADVFLFPSRYEGFGFPPLEAMACGTPVISSDRTSLPELIGDAGVLVDPDDVDAIERGSRSYWRRLTSERSSWSGDGVAPPSSPGAAAQS